MSPQSKREYREAVHLRYKNASRREKTAILDEFCATCGSHRKHAIRILKRFKRFTRPKPKRRGKPPVYRNEQIIKPLKEIWLTANLPCSKRFKAMLPIWLTGMLNSSANSLLRSPMGYRVHAVSGGEEALEYLRGNKADILVLDMIMDPGIDGLETYRKICEIHPKQKAIIASGFAETERVKEAQRLGAGTYVKKPYIMEKIGLAVRDELNKKSAIAS
ncbi:MAG: response regulator [Syntrophales bacterium]|nr:response regulator [Syntrophales bacterium]